ncbi:MAG TPA: hypothetical protein VGO11_19690 [Chthoniobacteraceae bacterium]|jgi:hypothetical protein|nr:hypothetical protein [Chthoniobacteraceae bacterium]
MKKSERSPFEDELLDDEWCDNHPWLEYRCDSVAGSLLLLRGRKIEIRWVFQMENFKNEGDDEQYFRGLAYDRLGRFYAVVEEDLCTHPKRRICGVKKLNGKQALTWFARNACWDAAFTREMCRAIDNPGFEFVSLVPGRRAKGRKATKKAEAFHEQLHLATALVECVRKLDADPTLANLGEACRSASKVHQALHEPANFKRAGQA